ncbi:molecular chaperone HtpG [Desulfitobacterium sp.]|uniref:molecular chaperone HtpG n=1 Tax=Desulfitobacterium sp. TaxID=49981 RepID=UPI002C803AB6|nr:molecular chaperone HtpG [Desulfitobacterium sp.]HVJ48821.1 molecular chaperone HtpG [Desulfitobacterium sp.]
MSTTETKEFQTEIRQLLDIVINSLYTDREIFLREIVSNASDAMEKVRFHQLAGQEIKDKDLPLEIQISTNEEEHTLTFVDAGIGMTKEELTENLGTIAHSGSKAFIQNLAEAGDKKDMNLIGQFGVGFYSAFMVAEKVTLYTRSYQLDAPSYKWESDGKGSYSIEEAEDQARGTRIILHLKKDAEEFAKPDTVKRIIKQYSSFVPYPVSVNEEKVNTVQALWTKNKKEITEEEYTEFYKFIANAYDEPLFRLHFSSDAPINLNTLLFVPKNNIEKFGFGRMEPSINLYCKKVLIQEQAKDILPEWLRFVRGVVDSEELPLNISRETMQDSALVAKLNKVVTTRFLKFLEEQAKSEPEKYKEFWKEFGIFLKEGAANDFSHRDELLKLLRFESSKTEGDDLLALEDYVSRMKEGQEAIYYMNGPSREVIEAGPYLEVFRNKDYEVIYTHEPIDDYVFSTIGEFEGKKLVSADQADLNLTPNENETDKQTGLAGDELKNFTDWLKELLGTKVTEVRESKRLVDSPAIMLSPYGTHSMQRMMQMMNRDLKDVAPGILEINPAHALILRLNDLRKQEDSFARLAAEQLFANAQIAAGIIVDPRGMVNRLNEILEKALG